MATITEDYVSFEIAKLLKSKKFHVPTRSHYDGRGGFGFLDICKIDWNNYKCFRERRCYSAPTLQMTIKWLREIHNIHIAICLGADVDNPNHIFYNPQIATFERHKNITYLGEFDEEEFSTYEEAIEIAIKYCLENLI